MFKDKGLYFLFAIAILLLVMLTAGFQTTIWYQVFGTLPAPQFWLAIVLYLFLYRKPKEALILSYLSVSLLFFFGWFPLGIMYFNVLALFVLIYIIKERIFWPGSGYFWVLTLVGTLLWHLVYVLSSLFFESQPLKTYDILDRLIQILLTPLVSTPLFYVLRWLEQLTEQPAEMGDA